MDISSVIKKMISITQFNKGKASQLFSRAQKGETLVVIKNNNPVAIIMSPEEYEILNELPKTCIRTTGEDYHIDCDKFYTLVEKLKAFDRGGE